MNSATEPTTQTFTQPRSISGRVFVIPFIIVLMIIGVLMFAVAIRFQTIMARLEEVRSLWPNASQQLKIRYERLAQESDVPSSLSSNVDQLRTKFEATSQFDRQSIASAELERAIVESLGRSWHSTDFEVPNVSKLMEADQRRKRVQQDMIGRLTIQSLRLRLPPIYQPLEESTR